MAVSLRASKHGLIVVDRIRRQRGWNKSQQEWIEAAEISPASLRRFWLSERITRQNFLKICEVIGIPWEEVADQSDPVENLPSAVERMKRLFSKTVEADWTINERAPKLNEATMHTLCLGWIHELFILMVQATEATHPEKSFYRLTQELIYKIGSLYESQPEEAPGFFVKVTVTDKPGSLHKVTGVFLEQEVNISQVHIVPDGEGRAALKISCEAEDGKPISAKAKRALEKALEKLTGVVIKADAWELGEPPTIA
jgi:predicted amino acid-binding ACT domain protein